MILKRFYFLWFALITVVVQAQELSIDAMIRPRFEYRHGFQDVAPDGAEPAAFVSQRSALLTKYSDSKITALLDLQDVSIWGDRPQLSGNDDAGNQFGFHLNRAWAEVKFGSGWSTKVGRQFLSYDDQRIFGALGWQQQQRTHDAALLKYTNESTKIDVGFAFNQNGRTNFNTRFQPSAVGRPLFQYKAMQFVHASSKFSESFKGSFLFINNTFQNTPENDDPTPGTYSRQTTGVFGDYNTSRFVLTGSFYYQFGQFTDAVDISAYQGSLFGGYKPESGALKLIGLGAEILSGNDGGAISEGETNAFFPLFGTNHKFNGFQDFFYVGRHANDVGLIDLHTKAVLKTGGKSKLIGFLHYFQGAADARSDEDDYLGTAIDLVFSQGITPYADIKIGYSQSFLNDDFANRRANFGRDLDTLPAVEADSVQNWGWVMLTIKPNLFKWKKATTQKAETVQPPVVAPPTN